MLEHFPFMLKIVGPCMLLFHWLCHYFILYLHPSSTTGHNCSPAMSEVNPQLLPLKSPPLIGPSHIPSVCHNRNEKMSARKSFSKYKAPVSAKIYTVEELQFATKSFSEENLLGEGSLGSVYRAEFPDGQVYTSTYYDFWILTQIERTLPHSTSFFNLFSQIVAVKNINMVSLSFQEEEQFLDVIWTAARLRHPNIVTLLGYCVEHGQHLLVYEYIRDLSLDEVLHSGTHKPLSWTIRLNIALGIARALE